jgi:hypothetical protein
MTFGDLQNLVLWRLRQRGVNFGGAPSNGASDYNPPYIVGVLLNEGYAEFLSRTQDYPIAALRVIFPSTANAQSYSLSPIPPNGGTLNPFATRVYEVTYTQNAGGGVGIEYLVPIVSTVRFRQMSGAYTRRNSYYGPRPLVAAQLYGKPQLDVLPGTATAGDHFSATILPDVVATGTTLPAAQGGSLQNNADVPIMPAQFHMALADYAVAKAGDAADKTAQTEAALKSFEDYVLRAMEYGASRGEGDPEQRVTDTWASDANPMWMI